MKPSDKKQDYPDILHHGAINGTTGFCHELPRYLKLIAFSGDLGAPHAPLLPAPKPPHGCNTLVIEITYGDCQHEDRRSQLFPIRRWPVGLPRYTVIWRHTGKQRRLNVCWRAAQLGREGGKMER